MTATADSPRAKWVVLGTTVLIVFGALGLSQFSYPAILPAMQKALHLTNTQAGAVATANLIGYVGMAAIGGALAAHLGPRRVIALGLGAAALGMFITGLSHGFAQAALGRVVTGMGSAAASVPAHTLPGNWFSKERRGVVTGIVTLGAASGLVVSGPLVPRLVQSYGDSGWRATWFILAGATFCIAIVAYFLIRNRSVSAAQRVLVHQSQEGPGKWRKIYSSRPVWHLNGIYFVFGFAYMVYMTFITKRLVSDLGYSAGSAGRLFMIMGLASIVCGVMWGAISDALGRKTAIFMVLVTQAACYALFALWTTPAGLTVSAVFFGLTAWAIPAIMAVACVDIVGTGLASAAFGFMTVFHGLGQATGPYVAGRLADAFGSFTTSYLAAAAMALLGAIGASLLWKRTQANEGPLLFIEEGALCHRSVLETVVSSSLTGH